MTKKLNFPKILICKEFVWFIWWVLMLIVLANNTNKFSFEFFTLNIILCAFSLMYSQIKLWDRWKDE